MPVMTERKTAHQERLDHGFYNIAETAELLGITRSWLAWEIDTKAVAPPSYPWRGSRRLYFDRRDVERLRVFFER